MSQKLELSSVLSPEARETLAVLDRLLNTSTIDLFCEQLALLGDPQLRLKDGLTSLRLAMHNNRMEEKVCARAYHLELLDVLLSDPNTACKS